MDEDTDNQGLSSRDRQVEALRPYQWKKGQSGNPSGRKKGKTMKEYAKQLLECQTEEERQEFLHGLGKDVIWKMAEGNPTSDVNQIHEINVSDKIIGLGARIKKARRE